MGISIIEQQRTIILDTIRSTARGDWKVLVLDEESRKVVENVLKEDDILHENITNIEQIEARRPMNRDTDAIYILSPRSHIVDCLMADLERRRYRRTFLIWTSLLSPRLRERIDLSRSAKEQIAIFHVMNVEYFPRESHLVTFRDPYSFPILFHPDCESLVRKHVADLAQKIVSVCVSLEEYPVIRYLYMPNAFHQASALCSQLAECVQSEMDMYAQFHQDFPLPSNRPRGVLYIVDRSIDLAAPLIHEFTYQAMAHDLLPIRDADKVTFKTTVNEGQPNAEEKEMEITEKDRIWVENRHRHMKDTIEKLMGDFQKFLDANPHFTDTNGDPNSLNAIKDMLAGLPQFQEMKDAYALHLSMAQECMNIFQSQKLPDLATVEQSLATGLDEEYKKPRNIADQVVRTLDDEAVTSPDRLRLLALYILFRDGLVASDLQKLMAHAQLPQNYSQLLANLEIVGAHVLRKLKDPRPAPQPLFPTKAPLKGAQDEYSLSRFQPAIKMMLENHVNGTLDRNLFPSTKPELDAPDNATGLDAPSASLRSAKPTWAKTRHTTAEPRQRVIVFMAGGATYSESRACYEISNTTSRDAFLVTSHMLTPALFLQQLSDLSVDKQRLRIPADLPKPRAPAHLFEQPEQPRPPPPPHSASQTASPLPLPPKPPVDAMRGMSISTNSTNGASATRQSSEATSVQQQTKGGKPAKEAEKKKKGFFSSKK